MNEVSEASTAPESASPSTQGAARFIALDERSQRMVRTLGTSLFRIPVRALLFRTRPARARQKKAPQQVRRFSFLGVADGARTHDNRNHNPGLYQLSYSHRSLELYLDFSAHLEIAAFFTAIPAQGEAP